MGVWIEIYIVFVFLRIFFVTPFVGVWIEIQTLKGRAKGKNVTPFVGVWIEIHSDRGRKGKKLSLPSWECGLKSQCTYCINSGHGHSLRGSVD